MALPKAVLVNAGRLDFDNGLDLSKMSAIVELSRFEPDASPEEILERVQGQEIIITKEIPVPGAIISQFPDCVKVIQEAGTGFNNIDLAAAEAKGITVLNCPAYSSDAVAQLVITFILNFSSSLVPQMRMLAKGNRDNFTKCLQVPHFELEGKTLGLIGGSGDIGSKVTTLAEALGMKVIISSRSKKPNAVPLEELLRTSDFVSLHCPLNDDTRGIMNKSNLELMKPTAFLINTGRGPLVKEDELIEVLKAGRIAGAGLDVQVTEPPAEDSPLYELENVILTPHIGWKRLETRQRLMDIVTENLDAYVKGSPVNVVQSPSSGYTAATTFATAGYTSSASIAPLVYPTAPLVSFTSPISYGTTFASTGLRSVASISSALSYSSAKPVSFTSLQSHQLSPTYTAAAPASYGSYKTTLAAPVSFGSYGTTSGAPTYTSSSAAISYGTTAPVSYGSTFASAGRASYGTGFIGTSTIV